MKIFKIAFISLSTNIIYRLNWFFGTIMDFLRVGMYWIFWSAVLKSGNVVGNYDLSKIFLYYILVLIVRKLLASEIGFVISDDIYTGRMSFHLIKPYPYFLIKTSDEISKKMENILQTLVTSILFVALMLFLNYEYHFNIKWYTILVLLNAAILTYLISYTIGLIGFWTHSVWAIFLVYEILFNIFGGVLFPLDIVPEYLLPVFRYSPFNYMLFYPVSIILEVSNMATFYSSLIIQYSWILVIFSLCFILNAYGKKKFEGIGL